MNKEMLEILEQFPTPFDDLYVNTLILRTLCKTNVFSRHVKKWSFNIEKVYRGYLYLIELVIISIMGDIEQILKDCDPNIWEILYSEWLTYEEVKVLAQEYPEFDYILCLNRVRKQLSKQRFSHWDEDILNQIFYEIKRIITEMYQVISKRITLCYLGGNIQRIKKTVMYKIAHSYCHVKMGLEFTEDWEFIPYPEYVGEIFASSLSGNFAKNYMFRSKRRIALSSDDYLIGYLIGLSILYAKWAGNKSQKTEIENRLKDIEHWEDLNKIERYIIENVIGDSNFRVKTKLFQTKLASEEPPLNVHCPSFLSKETLTNKNELNIIFRKRRLRVIPEDYPYYNNRVLFFYTLIGAIQMHKLGFRDKPQLIEFKFEYQDRYAYSYALHIPVEGTIGYSAEWVIFNKILFENDLDKKILDMILEMYSDKICLIKYSLDNKLLEEYLRENDHVYSNKMKLVEKIKGYKGLLGELLAIYFLHKSFGAVNLDFHLNLSKGGKDETDIDAIGETDSTIFLCQVKTYLPKDENELENIVEHFSKLSNKNLESKDKRIQKILFILHSKCKKKLIDNILVEPEPFELEKRKRIIEQYLASYGIEVEYLEKFIRTELYGKKEYKKLIQQLSFLLGFNF